MLESHFKGLLTAAGKAIARMPASPGVVEMIERAETPEELREVLEQADLGLAEPATRALIDRLTREDWEDFRWSLILAWDVAYNNRMFPGS